MFLMLKKQGFLINRYFASKLDASISSKHNKIFFQSVFTLLSAVISIGFMLAIFKSFLTSADGMQKYKRLYFRHYRRKCIKKTYSTAPSGIKGIRSRKKTIDHNLIDHVHNLFVFFACFLAYRPHYTSLYHQREYLLMPCINIFGNISEHVSSANNTI